MSPTFIKGFSELIDRYDVFLLDQFGVLHNGTHALPGAIECFKKLQENGKTLIILSNTSKRAAGIPPGLESLGFPSNVFASVTGGETAWEHLTSKAQTLRKCALMTSDVQSSVIDREKNPKSLFHDLAIQLTTPDQADCLVVEGTQQICYSDNKDEVISIDFRTSGEPDEHVLRFMEEGIKHKLPLLCINPDHVAIMADNKAVHMPGKIADRYAEMGGEVLFFGKPMKEHYQECVEIAKYNDKRERVIHVGDSLQHDIKGANNADLASVFIGGGVHAHEIDFQYESEDKEDASMNQDKVNELFSKHNVEATYAIARFRW